MNNKEIQNSFDKEMSDFNQELKSFNIELKDYVKDLKRNGQKEGGNESLRCDIISKLINNFDF